MTSFRDRVKQEYKVQRAKGYRPKLALQIAKFEARYSNPKKCPFDNQRGYAGEEERVYPNGWKLLFKLVHDEDYGPPWKECDGHGEVECTRRTLENWERDWVLRWDGYDKLVYDYKASLEIAKRDGWGCGRPEDAVKADFDYLYGYCNDDWWYVGIIVQLYDEDGLLIDEDSCWGFETSSMSYLFEEARSWAAHMLKKHMPRYWQRLRQMELTL